MQEQRATLPNDFGIGSDDTLIYHYSNKKPSVKNKVVFTTNMICFLQHGVKGVETATGREVITSKDVLILANGSTLMSESVAEGNRYEALLVFFGNKTLADFCAHQNISIDKKIQSHSILKVQRDEFLQLYSQSLSLLAHEPNTNLNRIKVQEVLSYLSLKFSDVFQRLVAQALSDKTDIKLRQVVELHAGNNLTVEELAFLCNQSLSTFKRHFTDLYGVSPQKYFLRKKMEQAKALLSLQRRPSEVSAEIGYGSLSSFSNEFKKHFGISPKTYQHKNAPVEKAFGLLE
jgi:AraC-like DNA-binding protein